MASKKAPAPAGANLKTSKYASLNLNSLHKPVAAPVVASTAKPAQKGLIVLGVPGKDKKGMNSKLFEPPKPVQLGSLKAENRGLDPTINLVPAGGLGWGKKADTTPKASPEQTPKAAPSAPPKLSMPKAVTSARPDSKGDVDKDKPSEMSKESDTPKAQSPSWGGWGKTPKAGAAVTGKLQNKDFPTLARDEAAASNASAVPTSVASVPSKPSREEADVEEAAASRPTQPHSRMETGGARASTLRRGASWADQDGGDDSDRSSGRGRGGGGRGSVGSDTSDSPPKETRSRPSKASRSEPREKRRAASKEEVDKPAGGKSTGSGAKASTPPDGGSSGSKEDVLPADQRAWMREAALRRAAERRKEEDAILAEQRARAAEKLRALDERAAEKKRQKEEKAGTEATLEPKAEPRIETKAEDTKPVKPRKTWENIAEKEASNGPESKQDLEDIKPEAEVSSRAPPASGQRNGTQGRGWHTGTEDAVAPKPADVATDVTVSHKPVPDQAPSPPHSKVEEAPAASQTEPPSGPKRNCEVDAVTVQSAEASEEPTPAADEATEVPKWQKPAKPTRGDSDSDWRRRDDRYWKGREAAPEEEAQPDCMTCSKQAEPATSTTGDDAAVVARRALADEQAAAEKAQEQRPAPSQARAGQAGAQVRLGQVAPSQARVAPAQARPSQSVAQKVKPPTLLQQGTAVEANTEPAARAAARAVERAGGSVWAARAEAQALLEAAKLKEEEEKKKKAEEEAAAARAKAAEEAAAAKALRRKEAQWQDDAGAATDEAGGKGKGKGKGRKAKGKGSYAIDGEAEAQGEEEETGRAKGRSKGEKGGRAEKSGGKAEKGAGKAEKGAGKAEKGSAKGKGKGKSKASWDGEDEVEGKGKGKKSRQRWVVKDAQESWHSKYDEEDYGWESSYNKDYSWDSKWVPLRMRTMMSSTTNEARRKNGEASSNAPADTSAASASASADAEAQEQLQVSAEAHEAQPSRSQRNGEQSWVQRVAAPRQEDKGSHEVQQELPARPERSSRAVGTSERRGSAGSGGASSGAERKREGQTKSSTAREEAQPPPPRRPPPQPPAEPQKPKEADRQLVNTLHDIGGSGFSVGAGVVCVRGDTAADAGDDGEGDDEFQTVKSKKQQKAEKAEKKRLAEEEAKKEAKREAKRNKRKEAAGSVGEEAAVPSKASQEPSKDLEGHSALSQDESSALQVNAPAAGRQAPSSSMAVRGEVSEQSNESAGGASGSGSPAIGPLHMSGGFPSFGPFGAIGSLSAQPSKEIVAIWERPTAAPGFRAPPPFAVGSPTQPSTSSGGRPLRPVGKPPPYAPPVPARPLLRRQALQWIARQADGPLDAESSEIVTDATAPARPAGATGSRQNQAEFAPSSSSSRRPKDVSAPSADGAAQGGGRGGRGRGGRGGRGVDAAGAAQEASSTREDTGDAPKGRSFYSEKGGKRSKGRGRGEKGGEKGDSSAGKRESYYAAHAEMSGGRSGRDTSVNEGGGAASTSAQGKAASRGGDGQRGRGRGAWRDVVSDQLPRDEGTQRSHGERGSQARSSGSAADRAEDAPRSRGRGKGRGRSQGDTAYSENPRVNATSTSARAEGSATADSESRGRGSGRGSRRGGGKMMYKPKVASTS